MRRKPNSTNNVVKDCMVTALIQLLKTKPMSDITVTDITEKAEVSRMSYYRNYSSIEDILTDHIRKIFKAYKDETVSRGESGPFFGRENLKHCFEFFSAHQAFFSCLLKSGLGDLLLKQLTAFLTDICSNGTEDLPLFYKIQAFSGSIYNMYVAWIDRKEKESAEDMADILNSIYRLNPETVS